MGREGNFGKISFTLLLLCTLLIIIPVAGIQSKIFKVPQSLYAPSPESIHYIPEFPIIALPVALILGITFVVYSRNGRSG